jgi:hypothetical protein
MHSGRFTGPIRLHYAALVLSFGVIIWLGRDQWFFGDDWAILVRRLDGSVMLPHVGHWNLIPAVVFQRMRDWLGLGSYLPFLLLVVIAHLAMCHLIWRVLRRVGVNDWVATMLSILMMLFGGGAENIFWAFQFGFVGAIALGLAVLLLLNRARLSAATMVGIVALSIFAPMFSGTAIPVLVGAAIVGWVRHGFWRVALLLLPTLVSYLTWFILVAVEHPTGVGGISSVGDLPHAALYSVSMFGGGLGRALPWIGLGLIPAVAVGVWFTSTARRGLAQAAAPAYALVIGSIVFVALTTYSRVGFGLSGASAERYAYVILVLLLPAIGIMLSWVVERTTSLSVITMIVLAGLIGFNVTTLVSGAATQARREQASKNRVMKVLDTEVANPGDTALLDAPADPTWSPDARGSDLLRLYRDGELPLH